MQACCGSAGLCAGLPPDAAPLVVSLRNGALNTTASAAAHSDNGWPMLVSAGLNSNSICQTTPRVLLCNPLGTKAYSSQPRTLRGALASLTRCAVASAEAARGQALTLSALAGVLQAWIATIADKLDSSFEQGQVSQQETQEAASQR